VCSHVNLRKFFNQKSYLRVLLIRILVLILAFEFLVRTSPMTSQLMMSVIRHRHHHHYQQQQQQQNSSNGLRAALSCDAVVCCCLLRIIATVQSSSARRAESMQDGCTPADYIHLYSSASSRGL